MNLGPPEYQANALPIELSRLGYRKLLKLSMKCKIVNFMVMCENNEYTDNVGKSCGFSYHGDIRPTVKTKNCKGPVNLGIVPRSGSYRIMLSWTVL